MGSPVWSYVWTAAEANTTGALTGLPVLGCPERFTFYFVSGPGCTATVQMQAAVESTSPYVAIGSSAANLTTSACEIHQFVGPLHFVRPYITAKTTGVLKVYGFAN
jgi:hypothetical protein